MGGDRMDTTQFSPNDNLRVPPIPTGAIDRLGTVSAVIGGRSAPTEGPSDKSFLSLLMGIVVKNIRNAPNLVATHVKWLLPMIFIWMILGTAIRLYLLPSFIESTLVTIIFLTATYNNFIGKALYAEFIGREVLPFIKKIRAVGARKTLKEYTDKYTRTAGIIIKSFREKGQTATYMMLGYGGAGLIFANLLTRNNKSLTYFVCVTTALGIYTSLSRGLGDNLVRLFIALLRDITGLFKKDQRGLSTASIYVAMSSFALGLVLDILFWFIRFSDSYTDPTGYIIGGALVILSIVLLIVNANKGKTST